MKSLTMLLILVLSVISGRAAYADESSQKPARLDVLVPVQMDYLLYLPKDYEKQDSWPLLIFLHGSGERGDKLDRVKFHGPPKLVADGKDFPMIVVSPQCAKDKHWEPLALLALLDDLSKKYKIDADRVYLTGLSMGGHGTWELAEYAPDRFAALAPICGGGETWWAKRFAHIPVWAFHGAKDAGAPVALSQVMVDEVNKQGGNAKLTIYPEAEHDAWTETYNNPEFYEWLLAQKRSKKK